jgi:hypothetical protein
LHPRLLRQCLMVCCCCCCWLLAADCLPAPAAKGVIITGLQQACVPYD